MLAATSQKFSEKLVESHMAWAKKYSAHIVRNPVFEFIIFQFILISCISLALESPLLDPSSVMSSVLNIIDMTICFVFAVELFLRIVDEGFAFVVDLWGGLDVVVVIISFVTVYGGNSVNQVGFMRALRAVRPLRMINKLPGLRQILLTIISSLPHVFGVLATVILIYFVFAMFLVTFQKGQYRSCQGEMFEFVMSTHEHILDLLHHPVPWTDMSQDQINIFSFSGPPAEKYAEMFNATKAEFSCMNMTSGISGSLCCSAIEYSQLLSTADEKSITSHMLCDCWGGQWSNMPIPSLFDDVWQSFIGLFEMSVGGGWAEQMWATVDSTGFDMQPIHDYNIAWVYFFICFIVIVNLLSVNIFVSIMTESYQSSRHGHSILTIPQMDWLKTQRLIVALKPQKKISKHVVRDGMFPKILFEILEHRITRFILILATFFQLIVLACAVYGESDENIYFQQNAEIVLGVVFITEPVLKLYAIGSKIYFHDNWHKLDFLIAIVLVIGFGYYGATGSFSVLESDHVRTLRLLKVLRSVSLSVRNLVTALHVALPYVVNISLLMGLGE